MNSDPVTRALVQKARSGDWSAFDELFERHRERLKDRLSRHLHAPLREQVELDDVVQETLLRALQGLDRFTWRDDDSFLLWVAGIGRNVIADLARRNERARVIALESDLAGGAASPSRVERGKERLQRLQESVDGLSPDHRRVIYLARVEKRPIQAIAAELGRSPNAVSQLLMRAVEKLRTSFGETETLYLPDRIDWRQGDGSVQSSEE